jgi:hypothetical protein
VGKYFTYKELAFHNFCVQAQANKQEDENKSVEHAGGHVVDDSTSKLDNVLQTTLASGTHTA